MKKWIALACAAFALAGCSSMRTSEGPWNDGIWNSVLGYHGPTSALVAGTR